MLFVFENIQQILNWFSILKIPTQFDLAVAYDIITVFSISIKTEMRPNSAELSMNTWKNKTNQNIKSFENLPIAPNSYWKQLQWNASSKFVGQEAYHWISYEGE